jgi:hypothetical protein
MLITPLLNSEHEPTVDETDRYFDGLSYRQNLNVIRTGSISISNKQHFCATYYRGFLLSLATGALPHKKSNFVNNRCLKKDVTFRQYTSAVGGAYDEPTKQTRVICRGTTEIFEGQQSREAKDSR